GPSERGHELGEEGLDRGPLCLEVDLPDLGRLSALAHRCSLCHTRPAAAAPPSAAGRSARGPARLSLRTPRRSRLPLGGRRRAVARLPPAVRAAAGASAFATVALAAPAAVTTTAVAAPPVA